MSDIETRVRNAVNKCNGRLSLCRIGVTDGNIHVISEIWMNNETITYVNLSHCNITTLRNVVFPPCIGELHFGYNQLATLDGFVIPNGLHTLKFVFNLLVSKLTTPGYRLGGNKITTLDGFIVPDGLQTLKLVFIICIRTDNRTQIEL